MRDARFREAWRIYDASFAEFEKRTHVEQVRIHEHPRYRFSAILHDDQVVGVLACWALPGFWFVEHFAIAEAHRSAGFGGQAVRLLQAHVRGPVVLDVEPAGAKPESVRRIAFYERCGFHYGEQAVVLPAYAGRRAEPSHLMAWPSALDAAARDRALAAIEREVYGLRACDAQYHAG